MSIAMSVRVLLNATVAIALLAAGTETLAQGLERPHLCPETGTCVAPGSEPYDLSRFDIPFQYEWPNPPQITRTIRVPAEMSLSAAAAIPGAHIIVAPGSYGGFTINRADQWFDFDNGATITGDVTISRQAGQARTKFSGGRIVAERFVFGGGALDLLVDNVSMVLGSGVYPGLGNVSSNRVAIINTTIRAGLYGLYVDGHAVDSNYIFANLDIVGGRTSPQAAARLMSVHNVVFVDNRVMQDDTNGGNYTLRLHADTTNVFVDSNQFEATSGNIWIATNVSDVPSDIDFIYIRNNKVYRTSTGFHSEVQVTASNGHQIRDVWVENNELYLAPGQGPDSFVVNQTAGTVLRLDSSPNVRIDYTSTPAFAGGADH